VEEFGGGLVEVEMGGPGGWAGAGEDEAGGI
jgi:hypothetical protein